MVKDDQTGLYHEEFFNNLLFLEKSRCERTESPALLMLADLSSFAYVSERKKIAKSVMNVLSRVTRDTDIKGWHLEGIIIGVIFTETSRKPFSPDTQKRIVNKCLWRLRSKLGSQEFSRIQITWQLIHSGYVLDIPRISNLTL